MSTVDDIEESRELTELEDCIDRQWPCCGACDDWGRLLVAGRSVQCVCVMGDVVCDDGVTHHHSEILP